MIKPILLAEDFEDDAAIFQHILKKAGIMNPVIVVPDGAEAVAYLKGDDFYADRERFPLPTVLMLDLKMPRLNGYDVLEWCKHQPHLKDMLVVVLSGYSELHMINRAYELGADTFLVKPCNIEDLANLTKTFDGYWVEPQMK